MDKPSGLARDERAAVEALRDVEQSVRLLAPRIYDGAIRRMAVLPSRLMAEAMRNSAAALVAALAEIESPGRGA